MPRVHAVLALGLPGGQARPAGRCAGSVRGLLPPGSGPPPGVGAGTARAGRLRGPPAHSRLFLSLDVLGLVHVLCVSFPQNGASPSLGAAVQASDAGRAGSS